MTSNDTANDKNPNSVVEREVALTLAEWSKEQSVYWSDARNAWIVTNFAEAAEILKDSNTFWRNVSDREGSSEFWGRHLMNLEGRDHQRMHAVHMHFTGEPFAERIRDRVSQICRDLCDGLVRKGHVELSAEYANYAVLLIGLDFLGFDISDRSLVDRVDAQMSIRAKWKEALLSGDGISLDSKIAQDGKAALQVIRGMLLPIIRGRREHPQDDLISLMWQKGVDVFPDWNEHDIMNAGWSCLDNEGKPLQRGLLYILCRNQELQAKLRQNPSLVPSFVQEGLRFLSPLRVMQRVARKDVEIGGQQMRKGDAVSLVTPLANRDEERWACPYSFDPDRPSSMINLAFGYGPGYCVGRYVGRMEAEEAIKAILARTSKFTLDPAGAEPQWAGDFAHSVSPIHAILE
ncbi:MAG: cytochrome P450 [Variibacter sp.]